MSRTIEPRPYRRSAAAIYRTDSVPAIAYSLVMSKKIDSAATVEVRAVEKARRALERAAWKRGR